jgi:uncharacterized phage protein gp47/JayE
MPFETPTLDEEHEFLIAHFRSVRPEDDVSQGSFNWLWLRTVAAGITGNHAHVAAVKNDLMPDTAEGAMLERWGAIRGVTRKSATPARKADALRIFGTVATVVPDATEYTHVSGLRFRTSGANAIGSGGYVDADVVAIDTGSQTRLAKGEQLTIATPLAGTEDIAELQLDLDEDGEDQESDGALRERVLSRFSDPPLGGAATDYEQWALEETGIADAYAYPLRQGAGSVDLVALHAGSGTARILTEGERVALESVIDAKRPVAVKAFRVLKVMAETVPVEVEILDNGSAASAFDFDDSSSPVVLAYNAGTRTVQLSAVRPATMDAGDRVVFARVDGTGTGRERVIESLSSTDSFVLEVDDSGDVPDVGAAIYSGGPLVESVREAIQAMFDELGSANPDDTQYGAWEGNVDPDAISDAARDVAGVKRAYTIEPAALVEADDPSFPDDDEIGLLIAGRILVHKHHP